VTVDTNIDCADTNIDCAGTSQGGITRVGGFSILMDAEDDDDADDDDEKEEGEDVEGYPMRKQSKEEEENARPGSGDGASEVEGEDLKEVEGEDLNSMDEQSKSTLCREEEVEETTRLAECVEGEEGEQGYTVAKEPGEEEDITAADEDSEWETDEDEDDNAPWEPRLFESLFDGHESDTFAENLDYMRTAQGFVIPFRGNLQDPEGLVSHLQRRIYRKRACVWCERTFTTLEGVRAHMRDKQHVKIRCEPPVLYRRRRVAKAGAGTGAGAEAGGEGDNTGASAAHPMFDEDDGYVPELMEFYDFGEHAAAVVDAATFDAAQVSIPTPYISNPLKPQP